MNTFQLWQPNPASNPTHVLMRQSSNGPAFVREVEIGGNLWDDGKFVQSEGVSYTILKLFK